MGKAISRVVGRLSMLVKRSQSRRPCQSNQNHLNSPLLRLPTELRLLIYSYVITSRCKDYTKPGKTQGFRPGHIQPFEPWVVPRYSGLLLTCRQTYTEAKRLPFELLAFQWKNEGVSAWWHKLPKQQKRAIQNLRLVFSLGDPTDDASSLDLRVFDKGNYSVGIISTLKGLRRIYITIRHHRMAWKDKQPQLKIELACAVELVKDMATVWAKDCLGMDVVVEVEAHGLQDQL